jgi:hypothetical protein
MLPSKGCQGLPWLADHTPPAVNGYPDHTRYARWGTGISAPVARCDDLRRGPAAYDEVLQFQAKNGLIRCHCKSVSDIVVDVPMTMRRLERLKVFMLKAKVRSKMLLPDLQ